MSTHDIANIPDGWVETTLGEVVDILDWDRGSNYPNGDDFSSDWYCLFLNTKNVPNTQFSFSEKIFITKQKDELLRKWKLQRGDYVMTTRWTIGNFAHFHNWIPYSNVRINSGMIILRVDKKLVDENFFWKYLNSFLFRHQFTSLQSGSAVPQLPIRDIKTFRIILPPLPEQKAIARMLSSFDDKIELLREQNKTLEKTAQTIFAEWFGKYSPEKPEELPEGWRVGKLGEVIENFDSKRIPIASDKRSNWIYPYYGATWINDYVEDYIFDGIYTLLWEDGSVIKDNWKPFTQYVWWKIWVNNHAHVLQGKNWFSTELIKIILDKTDIAPYVNGAVQLKINQSNMNSIAVIIPDKETLLTIDRLIKPAFSKLRNNFEQIQSLSRTRDELLPRLMNGEVRV